MKRNYTLKMVLLLTLALCFTNLKAQENVRILRLDPATNSVTLKNFGDAPAPIANYWFCVRPAYAQLNGMTSATTLNPGEEIDIASSVSFPVASGEFALYNSPSFGSSSAMLDFLQWGTGATSSREPEAVAAGLWVANTFITDAPPFQYNGDGTQNGVDNWSTLLSTNDLRDEVAIKLYPNPASTSIKIEVNNAVSDIALRIYDMLGKEVFIETFSANKRTQIDISDWNSGLYLIKMASENGSVTKRFVKN